MRGYAENGKFTKEGHIFSISEGKTGKVILSYDGKEGGFPQGFIWPCDTMEEAMDMVDAVIDPDRYPQDEWNARHKANLLKRY